MAELMQAHHQWATRPDDQRFTSLPEMLSFQEGLRDSSRSVVVSSRRLHAEPTPDNRGLLITGPNGHGYAPSHWAFGQAAGLISAPAQYLRELPAPLAADCLNYGFQVTRDASDTGVLITKGSDGTGFLRALTGPKYGRIWDADITRFLIDRVGDGVSGDWRVPGVWGKRVEVDRKNTTLYASDRDMWVFLADEDRRIEVPNRRNGQPGSMARGFFIWNSEVGSATLGVKTFLFDYVCANRIVWGAKELEEIRIRHTVSAPDRFLDQVAPALIEYSRSSASDVSSVIARARENKVDKIESFLATRFGPRIGQRIQHAHMLDEGRPIETAWDAVVGATAYARQIPHQAERIQLEEQAGQILDLF
jgi:hypothetical protein